MPVKVDFPSGKSCLGSASVRIFQRKIQPGSQWEVSLSKKFRACGARKTTSLPPQTLLIWRHIKSCGAFKEIFYLNTSHRRLLFATGSNKSTRFTQWLKVVTPRLSPVCNNGFGAEGAEKFLWFLLSTSEDFLHFCEVSGPKSIEMSAPKAHWEWNVHFRALKRARVTYIAANPLSKKLPDVKNTTNFQVIKSA